MNQKIPFTPTKYKEMQAEFKRLRAEREQVMERLKEAREMGDLSENGAYKYAKFELGSIGRQLRQLRKLLQEGEPVTTTATNGSVGFGSKITITNAQTSRSFTLVSEHESDPSNNLLSLSSPIGKALQNKKVGDSIEFDTPRGKAVYTLSALE